MRDSNRIERVLHQLDIIWNNYPDMRFGQLIENLRVAYSNYVRKTSGYYPITDFYYVEDDGFEDFLKNFEGF